MYFIERDMQGLSLRTDLDLALNMPDRAQQIAQQLRYGSLSVRFEQVVKRMDRKSLPHMIAG